MLTELLNYAEKKQLVFICGLLVVLSALEMGSAYLIMPLLNSIINGINFRLPTGQILGFNELAILMIGVVLIKGATSVFSQYSIGRLIFRVQSRLSNSLLSSYLESNLAITLKVKQSDFIKTVTNTVNSICFDLINPLLTIISETLVLIGLAVIFVCVDFKLSLILFGLFSFAFTVNHFAIRDRLKQSGIERNIAERTKFSILSTVTNNLRTIVLNKYSTVFSNQMTKVTQEIVDAGVLHHWLQAAPRVLIEVIGIVFILTFLFFGDKIGPESFPKIGLFVALLFRVIPSIGKIGSSLQILNFGGDHMKELQSLKASLFGEAVEKFSIDVTKINIKKFDFKISESNFLRIPAEKFANGDIVGITGPSGSGKSTFIDILLGIKRAEFATILYNDNVVADYKKIKVGYLSHSPLIINGTVRENIELTSVNSSSINEIDYFDIIKNCGMDVNLPFEVSSYQTLQIGDSSRPLSSGQKQRLALSRLYMADFNIYILDEALNSLDAESEYSLISNFVRKKSDRSIVFIISHRRNIYELCNKMIRLN